MKLVFIIILAIATLASCSGNKKVAKHATELESSTHRVVSYGPKGKIILDKTVETPQKISIEENLVVEENAVIANGSEITETQQAAKQKVNKISEGKKAERTRKYVKVTRKIAHPIWEPYRDKNAPVDPSKNGFAIAGFVMSFFWFLAPLAFVFNIVGMRSEKRGLAIAGIVLSGLTLLFFLIALVLFGLGYI